MLAKKRIPREERQMQLTRQMELNPLCTDEDLARHFGVSIPTIRLDRMALGIPELRQRMRTVAQGVFGQVRSLAESELVGELLDVELGKSGLSVLQITPEMVLGRTRLARGHVLFAQANSLAVAVIDAEHVLTGGARIRYKRPVSLNERVVAKAVVRTHRGNTYLVSVYSKVAAELVFKGQFIVSAPDRRVPREV